jgi:hypothetical protein
MLNVAMDKEKQYKTVFYSIWMNNGLYFADILYAFMHDTVYIFVSMIFMCFII